MYATVTEVIDNGMSEPKIFRDYDAALECFNEIVKENGIEVVHTDDFCQIASNENKNQGSSFVVYFHFNIEVK